MADTPYKASDSWSETARYTAAEDVDVLLSAVLNSLTFSITADDVAPAFPAGHGHPVAAGASLPMKLKAGERLWIASSHGSAVALLGILTP